MYIFYCLGDVKGKETDGKYFVFLNYPPLWDTHWLGAVAPPLPWTPSLASPQPDFNSSLSAACIAFNFHFLLQPMLNWVLVTAPALAGELWKAKAGASKWLLQGAGNGSTGWKELLIVTILLLSCSGVQGESWRSQPPAVELWFLLGTAHLGGLWGSMWSQALPVLKPGAAPLVKVQTSRAQSAKDRKHLCGYWYLHPGISPGERWSLSPGAPRLCMMQAWKTAREKQKVLIWTTSGFCWSLATDLRPRSGFLGPSYPIPKPTRKPFQKHFISSAIVIVPSKDPMSPGQVGCTPSSPEIPALPSLSSLTFPSICAWCGRPRGL